MLHIKLLIFHQKTGNVALNKLQEALSYRNRRNVPTFRLKKELPILWDDPLLLFRLPPLNLHNSAYHVNNRTGKIKLMRVLSTVQKK